MPRASPCAPLSYAQRRGEIFDLCGNEAKPWAKSVYQAAEAAVKATVGEIGP